MALSESARAASAQESVFRQIYRQSTGRVASLIALDPASEHVVSRAVAADPARRRVVELPRSNVGGDWIAELRGRAHTLLDGANGADLVGLIVKAGTDSAAGALFGEACRLRGVPVTVLVIDSATHTEADLSRTLAPLRQISTMLVVATGSDYVDDMLAALRA